MRINEVNLDKVVEKKYSLRTYDYGLNYTNTSLFVLPMIGIPIIKLGKYFVNCFVKDQDYATDVDRPLFLLFKFNYKNKDEELHCKNIHELLINREEFITFYYAGNVENSKSVIYLFSIDEEFTSDYNMFLDGKYSKFRPEYKERFPKYITDSKTGRQQRTIMSEIINKSSTLRKYWSDKIGVNLDEEQEVWSRPNLEEIETI
jgi:hypothetical protein